MAAALSQALEMFGCCIAQFNNMSIILQIAIIDNPNIAMLYDAELQNRLSKYARERTPAIDYYALLSTLKVDILRIAQQRELNNQTASSTTRPPGRKGQKGEEKGNTKGEKSNGKGGPKEQNKKPDALKENE